jgi:tRNA1(Val) A37 N6-methylase TrmN6
LVARRSIAGLTMDTTLDGLLNKRVVLEQPAEGFRVAVDTVLLAAAAPAQNGQRVLDMGCGVGGVIFCLIARMPGLRITGIDIQEELLAICRKNIEHNKCADRVDAVLADATSFVESDFDHVVMNPPFHEEARHAVSDNKIKRTANAEKTGELPLWLASAAKALKPSGILTLIHRADRQDEILLEATKYFGTVDILPIISKMGAAPKRVIMRMHKGGPVKVNSCKSFVLYGDNGRYNEGAEAVIRHCKAIEFVREVAGA